MPENTLRNSVQAWTFLALGDSRQFAGNTGYDDSPARHYRYDSTVPNHRHVGVGDLAVIRDADRALGMGWIGRIDEYPGRKLRRRCPQCGTTALKTRHEKQPRFRCDNGHECDHPREETVEVVCYCAEYGNSWRPLHAHIDAATLAPLYVAKAQQHAIRKLHFEHFAAIFRELPLHISEDWWDGVL